MDLQSFVVKSLARAKGVPADVVSEGVKVGAVEWVIIAEMIMQFVIAMIEKCQQNRQELAATCHAPTRLQRAWFRGYVSANWTERRKWGWRLEASETADAMLTEAAVTPQDELASIVDQVRNIGVM